LLLAERTGWTLDYIESFDDLKLFSIMEVYDAIDTAKAHIRKRGAK